MKVLVKRYNVYLALFLLILFNGIFTNNFLRMNTCWNIVIQCTTIMAALAVSVICGLLNGVIIAKFQIQPMIVTLGMMNMVRGFAELMNDGRTYSFHHPVF